MNEEKHSSDVECGGSEECAILKRMLAYEYSEDDLVHLEMTDDRCHVRLYGHPARDRYDRLQQFYEAELAKHAKGKDTQEEAKAVKDFTPFVYRSMWEGEHEPEKPEGGLSLMDKLRTIGQGLGDDVQLRSLIAEVKRNGHGKDLVLADGGSLLTVVDRKLAHPRSTQIQKLAPFKSYHSPLTRAHMLAVILYTGCDCNYAMCAAERSGDYKTWQWFSHLLTEALHHLWDGREEEPPVVYSGIPKVRLEAKVGDYICLATHTSTSDGRAVAEQFAKGGGMILEFEEGYNRGYPADVSWISKFPNEREVLRTHDSRYGYAYASYTYDSYYVKSVKVVDGQQHVVLGDGW